MTDERDVLTRAYAAFNARNIDAVLAAMHPDVDWPNGWEGGRVRGHDQVRDYWTRQGRQSTRRSSQLDSRPIARGARW
jgi:ketosteroid isomerase-like protein